MELLKFDEESVYSLSDLPEAGMDFHLITGRLSIFDEPVTVAVRSNGYALPIEPIEGIFSLPDLLIGKELPREDRTVTITSIDPILGMLWVTLPSGYMTSIGAHQLLGSIQLSHPTRFFRYISSPVDARFKAGQITNGTYLTSLNDQQLANSGFGAVGRYALPLPMPASYKHDYTIPANTQLLVGTVAPQFGQSGGGVEVFTTSSVPGVKHNQTTHLDDF